jgi:thymidylate synthase
MFSLVIVEDEKRGIAKTSDPVFWESKVGIEPHIDALTEGAIVIMDKTVFSRITKLTNKLYIVIDKSEKNSPLDLQSIGTSPVVLKVDSVDSLIYVINTSRMRYLSHAKGKYVLGSVWLFYELFNRKMVKDIITLTIYCKDYNCDRQNTIATDKMVLLNQKVLKSKFVAIHSQYRVRNEEEEKFIEVVRGCVSRDTMYDHIFGVHSLEFSIANGKFPMMTTNGKQFVNVFDKFKALLTGNAKDSSCITDAGHGRQFDSAKLIEALKTSGKVAREYILYFTEPMTLYHFYKSSSGQLSLVCHQERFKPIDPTDIAKVALLAIYVSAMCGASPEKIIWSSSKFIFDSDSEKHMCNKLYSAQRVPNPFPTLAIAKKNINDLTVNDCELYGYDPYPPLPK